MQACLLCVIVNLGSCLASIHVFFMFDGFTDRQRKEATPKPSPTVNRHAAAEGLKLTKDELREVVLVKVGLRFL